MHISPNNRNAIHPGDRILEINGTPVRTLRVEEVQCVLWEWDTEQTLREIRPWPLPFPTPSLSLCLASEPVTTSDLLCQPGTLPGQQGWPARLSEGTVWLVAAGGHTGLGSSGLTVGGLQWDSLWSQPYTALGHR